MLTVAGLADCRQDFHIACRTWALREYEAGRVSLTALRTPPGQRARCIERDSDPKGPLVSGRVAAAMSGQQEAEVVELKKSPA